MYPSLMQMLNCSKETKLSTALVIDNSGRVGKIKTEEVTHGPVNELGIPLNPDIKHWEVEDFFSNAVYSFENAVYIEHEYFELPDYREMGELIREMLRES